VEFPRVPLVIIKVGSPLKVGLHLRLLVRGACTVDTAHAPYTKRRKCKPTLCCCPLRARCLPAAFAVLHGAYSLRVRTCLNACIPIVIEAICRVMAGYIGCIIISYILMSYGLCDNIFCPHGYNVCQSLSSILRVVEVF